MSPSRYTVEQQLFGGQMADVVKANIWGLTTGGGGGYVAVKVNPSGAFLVEADVTDTVGLTDTELRASPVDVALDAEGSPTGGAAGTTSVLAGGIYNSTPPTLTNGQQASLQLTSDGSLKVSSSGSGALDYGVSSAASRTAAAKSKTKQLRPHCWLLAGFQMYLLFYF